MVACLDEGVVSYFYESVVACLDKNNKDDLEKIQIWTAATRDMISSQLEVVSIMSTSISITWSTDMAVSVCARLL